MIDCVKRQWHPIQLAAALLRRAPLNKRGTETKMGEVMLDAAYMIRQLFNENEILKKKLTAVLTPENSVV